LSDPGQSVKRIRNRKLHFCQ